jgi:site-specific DNA recombinase
MNKKAAMYVRVSSRDQIDGFSMDDQRHTCQNFAHNLGMHIVKVYEEPGRSAYKGWRPVFEQMKEEARLGLFDAVIVYKYDRFSRQTRHMLNMAIELEHLGIEVYSATENHERNSASGKLTFTLMSAVAQFSSDTTGERVASARREAFNQGLWVGPVPIGYTRNPQTRILEPDADAPAVVQAYQLYALGTHSYVTIADALNALGYRIYNVQTRTRNLFSKDAVRGILHNPVYIGQVCLKGTRRAGHHLPLIDQETWDTVQARLNVRAGQGRATLQSTGQRTDVTGLLAKIAACAHCGSTMHLQNGVNRTHPYYLCSGRARRTCQASMARIDLIDEQVYQLFESLVIPEAWYADILSRVQQHMQPAAPVPVDRAAVQQKLQRLALTFTDGAIDEQTYTRKRQELQSPGTNWRDHRYAGS